jgi:predicted XRE-type DNA-binding protein
MYIINHYSETHESRIKQISLAYGIPESIINDLVSKISSLWSPDKLLMGAITESSCEIEVMGSEELRKKHGEPDNSFK